MGENKDQLVREEKMERAAVAPPNPEERAFSGHPDRPPSSPDHPVEGNRPLLDGTDDSGKGYPGPAA